LEGNAGKLKNDFIDDDKKNLEIWTAKHNNYSTREVREIFKSKKNIEIKADFLRSQTQRKRWIKTKIFLKLPLFYRAFFYFIYRYFFRLGFLDGKEGLIFHFLQGFWYRFLVDAKLYEYKKLKSKC
jgi:hypothetical protein